MAYTPVPDVTAGDFGRASWADIVKDDLADHETRIVAVEATGTGDVVGPVASVEKEIALFDATTGKLLERATGTGYVKVSSGVYQTPVATVPTTDLSGQVALATQVSGDLPFANLAQGSALSVLGVTGNATADNASIAAASDHQVLRRSGTAVAFGAVNLAQSAAVTGVLPFANLPANMAQIYKATVQLNHAQIIALHTTPITIVPAPGAGLRLVYLFGELKADTTLAAYNNIDATISYSAFVLAGTPTLILSAFVADDANFGRLDQSSVFQADPLTGITSLLGTAGKGYCPMPVFSQPDNIVETVWWTLANFHSDWSALEDKAIKLFLDNNGSGNLGGGNAANTLTATVVYMIL